MVEGLGHRGAPLHDQRIGTFVFDVAPADVPVPAVALVDPPEQQRPRRVSEQRDTATHRDLVVEILEPAGGHDPVEHVSGPGLHRGERFVRRVDEGLLGREVVAHRVHRWALPQPIGQAVSMAELTLMAVHAHPDDESNSTGGTLARYAAEGVRTVLVTCTNGEFGDAPGHIKPGEDGPRPRRRRSYPAR